jgi:RNA polymerase sigma-70 factor (ECF subfamily)
MLGSLELKAVAPIHSDSDAELLSRVPDPDAVASFYERHFDRVLRYAVLRCRDPEDAADLVSTVFLQLFTAARSFDPGRGSARSWLFGIAARCLADARREGYQREDARRRLGAPVNLDADQYERVEQMIDAARSRPAIELALGDRITARERDVFLLVASDGLEPAEAADALGLKPVVARMRLARARRKLRVALDTQAPSRAPLTDPQASGDRP